MLDREHVCIEIGNPLLTLLRNSKVAQGISDIRPDRLPEEIWIDIADVHVGLSVAIFKTGYRLKNWGGLLRDCIPCMSQPDVIN